MIMNSLSSSISSLLGVSGNNQVPAVLGSASGSQSPRFDLTLLELTKKLADSQPMSGDILVPDRVHRALEGAVISLSDLSADQLNQLGSDQGLKKTLVERMAQEYGLNIPQQAQIQKLFDLAIERLTSQFGTLTGQMAAKGIPSDAITAASPGPKGGTAVMSPAIDKDDVRAEAVATIAAAQGQVPLVQTVLPSFSETEDSSLVSMSREGQPNVSPKGFVLTTGDAGEMGGKGLDGAARMGGKAEIAVPSGILLPGIEIERENVSLVKRLSDELATMKGNETKDLPVLSSAKSQPAISREFQNALKNLENDKMPLTVEILEKGSVAKADPGTEIFVTNVSREEIGLPVFEQGIVSGKRTLDNGGSADGAGAGIGFSIPKSSGLSDVAVKDVMASMERQNSLRETVFHQTVTAIQEASGENSEIKIRLKPESLGSLDVTLSVEGGKLTARLLASTAEVRDVFAANLQQFKQNLEAQGIQVNQLSVAVRSETGTQDRGRQNQQQRPASNSGIAGNSVSVIGPVLATSGGYAAPQRFSAFA